MRVRFYIDLTSPSFLPLKALVVWSPLCPLCPFSLHVHTSYLAYLAPVAHPPLVLWCKRPLFRSSQELTLQGHLCTCTHRTWDWGAKASLGSTLALGVLLCVGCWWLTRFQKHVLVHEGNSKALFCRWLRNHFSFRLSVLVWIINANSSELRDYVFRI